MQWLKQLSTMWVVGLESEIQGGVGVHHLTIAWEAGNEGPDFTTLTPELLAALPPLQVEVKAWAIGFFDTDDGDVICKQTPSSMLIRDWKTLMGMD